MGEQPPLRVRLLGGLAVDGRTEQALGSRKGRLLLKLLALARGRPVTADRAADVLWGDQLPAHPAEQLGVLVSRLRGVLGPDRLVRSESGYRLEADWLDVEELDQLVEEAAAALDAGRLGRARAAAGAALALARGPLLPGDDWAEAERVRVATQLGRAHLVAARAAHLSGDHGAAVAAAEAALAHDPYDEAALRLLMRAHGAAGRPASALAAYVRVRRRLGEDLGVDPSPETEALHDDLVLGRSVAPAGEVLRAPAAATPDHRGRVGLVGREAELARLDAAAAAVASLGRAELVAVCGEAGIGKTALVQAWSGRVSAGTVVLHGRCDELGRDLPLQPVADALEQHLRSLGADEVAVLLGAHADAIASLLAWPPTEEPTSMLVDAAAARGRLFAALLDVVERVSPGLVVLVVDDVHLAGPATLEWLAYARRRARRLLLVVLSRRPVPELGAGDVLELGPLDTDAAVALVGEAPPSRRQAVVLRAGGNPLLLLALAGHEGDDLPASVRDVVDRQAAALGEAATTVRAAAVLGMEVDLDLLAVVLDRPALAVLADVEAAATAGLLEDRAGGLAFRHELVREALAGSATAARRAFVHRAAARALADRPGADALTVAVHAHLGGAADLAVAAYERAADQALARFDLEAATAHLGAAVALGGSAHTLAARARVRMVALDLEAAAADAHEAVRRGGGAAALEVAAWVAYYRRQPDEARALADHGVAVATDDALRSSCLAVAGRVRHGAGDLAGAADRLAGATGPPPVRGVAQVWLAHVRVHQGEAGLALDLLEQPLADPDHLAHPWAALHGRLARAMALGYLGRPDAALAVCDDLDGAVERAGVVGARFLGPAANLRGWLLRQLGCPGAGDDSNRHALDVTSDEHGEPYSEAVREYYYVALLDLTDGALLAGDLDGAARLVDRLAVMDSWSGTMAWHQRHRLGLARARVALAAGDHDAAAAGALAVAADAEARGARRYELLARAWLGLTRSSPPPAELQPVVDGLATVAALEGWRLVGALADRHRVEAWRREAGQRVAGVIAAAGPLADHLRRDADRTLG